MNLKLENSGFKLIHKLLSCMNGEKETNIFVVFLITYVHTTYLSQMSNQIKLITKYYHRTFMLSLSSPSIELS